MQDDMKEIFNILNKKLESIIFKNNIPIGLYEGQMGICIYFYYLHKITEDKYYKKLADKILDNICQKIGATRTIDIKNGIAGIGLGVNYLIKNKSITGNANKILENIDNKIFRELSYLDNGDRIDLFSMIHLLYYWYLRDIEQKKGSNIDLLYRSLIIKILNLVYAKLECNDNHQEKSSVYKIDFELPQFLYVLSKLLSLEFYNQRIKSIINELSPTVCSIFPILHSNRLFLLWGMDSINKIFRIESWEQHINLLYNSIDISIIVNTELKDKNIYFNNGVASLYFITKNLKQYFNNNEQELYKHKILSAQAWELLQTDEKYFNSHIGLFNGFCGSMIALYDMKGFIHEN